MANNLTVTISAVDKATATIKRINDSMNRVVAPIRQIQRLGGEVAKNPVIDGLRRMGGAAGTVAKNLGIVSGSMVGITALGVVAGVAEMTTQWARLGREIGNTSLSLGTTVKGLVTMRGAARLAGLSAEAMDGSLESVRQKMQDARWGRNQPLVALMSRLGMAFRYTKDGSIDAVESLKDISDAMASQSDVGAKHTIAQAFGVDAIYPLLIKGRKAIEDYQASAEKLGATPNDAAIKRAEKFAESMSKVKLTLDGMKNQVGDSLISASQSSLDWLNWFITKKRHPWADSIFRELTGLFGDDPNEDRPNYVPTQPAKSAPFGVNAPLGIRSNNPLNLQPKGKEAVFSTMEAGIAAAVKNLMGNTYFGGGNDTVAGIVNRWSPPNAPGNSAQKTANYISAVQREVGTGHLDPNDLTTMAKLLSAIIRQENGPGTYDKNAMDRSIQHVLIEFKNAPPGMTATARNGAEASTPVRVVMAMPAMGSP